MRLIVQHHSQNVIIAVIIKQQRRRQELTEGVFLLFFPPLPPIFPSSLPLPFLWHPYPFLSIPQSPVLPLPLPLPLLPSFPVPFTSPPLRNRPLKPARVSGGVL